MRLAASDFPFVVVFHSFVGSSLEIAAVVLRFHEVVGTCAFADDGEGSWYDWIEWIGEGSWLSRFEMEIMFALVTYERTYLNGAVINVKSSCCYFQYLKW